ncbi:MAG: fluoride efflux transporter CrcB [Pseudomonadales bacterium]|nr:fluoride efflux transporter CrcB [Pseudomonadales bacterium]
MELLAIAIGGALGAVARFTLGNQINHLTGIEFPYSTLLVNIIGSFLIGIAFVFLVEKALWGAVWRSALMVGFLGAFTTFSTFSMQALGLLEEGRLMAAGGYIGSSVVVCILAVYAGMALARHVS